MFFKTNEKSVRTNTPLVSLSSSVNDNFLIVLGLGWSATTRRGASSALLVLANQCFYALQHLFQFKIIYWVKKKKYSDYCHFFQFLPDIYFVPCMSKFMV